MLGSLEAEVLGCLQVLREGSAREVRRELDHRGIPLAYTTVATILSRLHVKRVLRRRRERCQGGHRFVYRPVDFERQYLQTVLDGVVRMFGPAGVVHLNEEMRKLPPAEEGKPRRRFGL